MAERIVSPGVFTRERDLSFLPQGIGEIGAAIIGPTQIGPAFTPTQITTYQEFEEMFGGEDARFYTPYTVEQYLRSAGVVTVVRVLGLGGYTVDSITLQANTSASVSNSIAILAPSLGTSATADLSATALSTPVTRGKSFSLIVSGSDVSAETYSLSFDTGSANFIDKVISSDPQSTKSGGNTSSVYVYKVFKQKSSELSANVTASVSVGNAGNDRLNFEGVTFI